MLTHEFGKSLAFGESASLLSFWEETYRKAFHGYVGIQRNPDDNYAQRSGIDHWVTLSSGKVLRIDTKARKETRPDILLEFISNDRVGTLGWIEKDLPIDYMAYGFVDTRVVFLMPWEQLRSAWFKNRVAWKEQATRRTDGFSVVIARNTTYQTHSIAVPTRVLGAAIRDVMVVRLGH